MNATQASTSIKSLLAKVGISFKTTIIAGKFKLLFSDNTYATTYVGDRSYSLAKDGEYWLDLNNSILYKNDHTTKAQVDILKFWQDQTYIISDKGINVSKVPPVTTKIPATTTAKPITTTIKPDEIGIALDKAYNVAYSELKNIQNNYPEISAEISLLLNKLSGIQLYAKNNIFPNMKNAPDVKSDLIKLRLSAYSDLDSLLSKNPNLKDSVLKAKYGFALLTETAFDYIPGATTTVKPPVTTTKITATIKPPVTTTKITATTVSPLPCVESLEILKRSLIAVEKLSTVIDEFGNKLDVKNLIVDLIELQININTICK